MLFSMPLKLSKSPATAYSSPASTTVSPTFSLPLAARSRPSMTDFRPWKAGDNRWPESSVNSLNM